MSKSTRKMRRRKNLTATIAITIILFAALIIWNVVFPESMQPENRDTFNLCVVLGWFGLCACMWIWD